MKKKMIILGVALLVVFALSGCGSKANMNHSGGSASMSNMGDMNHSSSSGEVPAGLKEAQNPTFKVGSQATMKSDHMAGMNGATATIVGAYTTTAYAVSYTPTTGGGKVSNHKWVIHEEIMDAGNTPFNPGDEVVLQADHMPGMNGATATIDSAEQTTVYMVDYTPVGGGEVVKNHKWVTESELEK